MGKIRGGLLEVLPGCGLHECENAAVIEALELHPVDIWFALQGAEEIAERVGRRELGFSKRPEYEQSCRLRSGDDMTQEQKALTVRPLQVVEDRARLVGASRRR